MSAAVAAVEEAEGAVGALVNNAGYSQSGAVETVALDDVRRQFETNVFGLLRMCQLVLPGMRRQGDGRIVNVSSMGGKLTFPGGGVYHATKHAVEALSDALRFEVQGFGVDVAIIEPGLIKTNFAETAVGSVSYDDGPYAEFNTAVSANTAGAYDGAFGKLGGGPEKVAQGDRAGDHRAAAAHALPGHRVGAAVPRPARAAARPRLGSRGGNLLPAARPWLGFPRRGLLQGRRRGLRLHRQAVRGPRRGRRARPQVPQGEHDRAVPVPRARLADHGQADRRRGRSGGLR